MPPQSAQSPQEIQSDVVGHDRLEAAPSTFRISSKFDALVSDLSIGLPAEMNERRAQYEYYRDRLLAFEAVA